MTSLVLITAMTATTGLFGGKHCGQPKHHARRAVSSCYSSAPCGTSYASPYASQQAMPVATPQAGYAPAPSKMAPPTAIVPPAPSVPPTPSPSSALPLTGQPVVATGGNR